jgi:outer membrane receptor protein involved in Fe transport
MNINSVIKQGIAVMLGVAMASGLHSQSVASDNPGSSGAEGEIQTDVIELDEFTVTTTGDSGYYSAFTTSTTRTNTTVKNSPISLTVINEELMDDLNILNDEDLARATASVTRDPDGFSFNQIRIRGFRSLTQRYDLFWREIERDGYNIQRMDIVKGANSLIYGQADPGGKVNAIPKKAMYGQSFYNFRGTFGNKDYQRYEADANVAVTDDFAVRLMAFDFERDFDQLYKTLHLRGATLELGYRLGKNTLFRAHLERMETKQNLPPQMFFDGTEENRYFPNSLGDETDTRLRASLTAYRNEFIFNPDAVKYLPQEVIDDLILQSNPNPTREEIAALYKPWADRNSLYSSGGPDKINDRTGDIMTFDWIQKFSEDMQLKVSYNREDDDRYALTRMGYSASRVKGAVGQEFIETHWQVIDGGTLANAIKGTFLWELELDNLPLIGDSRHNILLGYDWDELKKTPSTYDQIKEGTDLFDGNYYRTEIFQHKLPLANGFGPDAPNIGFNGRDDLFQLRQKASSDVTTNGYWLAVQSEFFGGRLRSLAGIRYDDINITHSYVGHVISVAPGYFTNPDLDLPSGLTPETINTEFSDNNVPYDQWSPSVGALYWITDQVGIFANYAKSIQSPTGVDLDPFGNVIPPVYGEGYEYGLRFDLLGGKLNGQIIAFYIEKENDNIVNYDFRLSDIITYEEYGEQYPNYFFYDTRVWAGVGWKLQNEALPGKQIAGDISRAQGLDVEFYYNPTRNLSMVFSYTYNDLDAIKINENVNERFGRIFGLAPHNAIVHLRYEFRDSPLSGFSFGISQSYRSKSTMGSYYIDELDRWFDVDLDEEYQTDGFIRYRKRFGKGPSSTELTLTYRVNNLFDADDLMNRHRSASYRESIQHMIELNVRF